MFCRNCGKELVGDNDEFCAHCGSELFGSGSYDAQNKTKVKAGMQSRKESGTFLEGCKSLALYLIGGFFIGFIVCIPVFSVVAIVTGGFFMESPDIEISGIVISGETQIMIVFGITMFVVAAWGWGQEAERRYYGEAKSTNAQCVNLDKKERKKKDREDALLAFRDGCIALGANVLIGGLIGAIASFPIGFFLSFVGIEILDDVKLIIIAVGIGAFLMAASSWGKETPGSKSKGAL